MESEIIMQLMDELATLLEVAKSLKCSISKVVIELKISELQSVLESFLSIELE